MNEMLTQNIDWLNHASFRLRGKDVTIYVDPWKIEGKPQDGDIILVTHDHYDHLSMEDVNKVAKPDAVVVIPSVALAKVDWPNRLGVSPGETLAVKGISINVVRSYNTNKDFHPRSQEWVGYIVELDGVRIYHAGDSDVIDEMDNVSCDVALLPVSGTYVMTADEACEAVRRIGPKAAIPMHYGVVAGERMDAEIFADKASCEVVIKDPVR